MGTLLAINLVLLAAAAYIGLFYVVPKCANDIFRYRLWWYRDCLIDDISGDRYENPEVARELAERIEVAIAIAPHISRLRFWFMRRALTRSRIQREPWRLDVTSLSPGDRELIWQPWEGYHRGVQWKLNVGSPSGWPRLIVSAAWTALCTLADGAVVVWSGICTLGLRLLKRRPHSRSRPRKGTFSEQTRSHAARNNGISDDDVELIEVLAERLPRVGSHSLV